MLEAAVAAGLASAGVDVLLLGVLPTPAVAFLTDDFGADLGVVISASHNAMPDNGIKIFAAGGLKLDDAVEDAIERRMADPAPLPTGEGVGRIRQAVDADRRYLDHLLVATPNPLKGLRVVVDCAHGAASDLAPEVYRRAGAEVVVIGGSPDGLNINAGVGSTYLAGLRAAVIAEQADLGIAHDGDADRCLAIAADGSDVDGDVILALLAVSLKERGRLVDDTVVATVMANIGFHQAMAKAGIKVRHTAVGDRYVLEDMRAGGYSLGGEQSGHLILADHATTGDGLLSALHLMAAVAESGRPLAELASFITTVPADPGQRAGGRQGGRRGGADRAGSGGGGRGGTGRFRPGAAAPVGHRVAGQGDGRGRHHRAGAGRCGAGRRGRRERLRRAPWPGGAWCGRYRFVVATGSSARASGNVEDDLSSSLAGRKLAQGVGDVLELALTVDQRPDLSRLEVPGEGVQVGAPAR